MIGTLHAVAKFFVLPAGDKSSVFLVAKLLVFLVVAQLAAPKLPGAFV